jgi:hypothetical protein
MNMFASAPGLAPILEIPNKTKTTGQHDGPIAPRRAAFARSKRAPSRRFTAIQSTEDYHTFKDGVGDLFYGGYGHIRKMLDYTYHAGAYNKTRQFLHDSIIEGT